jgi:hypothetical protein
MKPIIYRNKVIPGYFFDEEYNVISVKSGAYVTKPIRKMKPYFNPTGKYPSHQYPHLNLSVNGIQKTIQIHRLVAETFLKKPAPTGITKKDWKATPESVKALVYQTLRVNHIDHDKTNYHPSNLEWVTAQQNSVAYQEYRVANNAVSTSTKARRK